MPWVVDTGNSAVAYAAKLSRVQVISAYPITPQTPIVEKLASMVESGELKARFIRTESEFSALAVCLGASLAGARAFTATSSQGLALMHELLHWTAGARAPVVMAVANRALGPPWTIWSDHTDMLSQRDTGWIQIYTWSVQEVFDSILQAFKVAEEVRLPTMVGLEGFILSHTAEQFFVPEQGDVDGFLPPPRHSVIDFAQPRTLGNLATPEHYDVFRYELSRAMQRAEESIERAARRYEKVVGRRVAGCCEEFQCREREKVIVAMGTAASEALEFVKKSEEFGLLRIRAFRPFPQAKVKKILESKELVVVLEKAYSLGGVPPLTAEISHVLSDTEERPRVVTFTVGVGGRDFTPKDVARLVKLAEKTGVKHAWYIRGELCEGA